MFKVLCVEDGTIYNVYGVDKESRTFLFFSGIVGYYWGEMKDYPPLEEILMYDTDEVVFKNGQRMPMGVTVEEVSHVDEKGNTWYTRKQVKP